MQKTKEIIRCCVCGRRTKEGICNPCIEKAKKEYREIEDNWRKKNSSIPAGILEANL